jgi:hypothetical protein
LTRVRAKSFFYFLTHSAKVRPAPPRAASRCAGCREVLASV